MSGCSNCFNGCDDIISDKCVKYTGNDFSLLTFAILTGDPLLQVETVILDILTGLSSGELIVPNIDLNCPLIANPLIGNPNPNIVEILQTVIDGVCIVDDRVTDLEAAITVLNANYTLDCITGVLPGDGTHNVLQAVINKVCLIDDDLIALTLDLHTNYVTHTQLPGEVQAYLDTLPVSTLVSGKMVPWVAVPYFNPNLSNFDITGAGIGDWERVFLCNGQNGTPDLRGRVLVGCTTMGNTPMGPEVNPSPGNFPNPAYTLHTKTGANSIVLTELQMPSHTHTSTVNINDPKHSHDIFTNRSDAGDANNQVQGGALEYPTASSGQVIEHETGLNSTNVTVTIDPKGNNQSHANIQPVYAANFIIYIPAP